MTHDDLVRRWDEAWSETTWYAAMSKALDHLTPAQAAKQPAPGRHSIWQIVHHLTFWHDYAVRRLRRGEKMTADEIERHNWKEPHDVSDRAWRAAVGNLVEARSKVREILADESRSADDLRFFLPHELYHLGQIMYVRAWLGLPPIE